ncbi:hypothetical protein [Butyrivibrio sp. AC2005]|uniref:hypothetical protein n=1 Tax=Butyrivibrio sp. AC2005 TaxID=1280672 RepID=UPI000415D216|nr:hypothetical protein [Butyrivibrio sp. AC2005]
MDINSIKEDLENNLIEICHIKDAISVIAESLNQEVDIGAASRALQFLSGLLEERTDSLSDMLLE